MKNRLIILMVIAAFVFEYQFIVTPLNKRIKSTEKLILKKKNDYKTLKNLLARYRKNQGNLSKKGKIADKNFSLFSFTGKIIENNNLVTNVKNIKPLPVEKKGDFQIERIKLAIENIPLEKLLKFISTIENSEFPVYISEFSMSRNKTNPSLLKVNIELTVTKNG